MSRVPLCIFAKPPTPGYVKTRLARQLGSVGAARLARAFFDDTWTAVQTLPWARPILATTTNDVSAFGLAKDAEVWQQGPGDLGARMAHVLGRAITEAGRGLVLGADLPDLPLEHLDAAYTLLETHDAVLGPASDGGFYLLGLSRASPGMLDHLPWSSTSTRRVTEERLGSLGFNVALTPPWHDVDEPDDLAQLHARLAQAPDTAPQTWAVLGEIM